MMSWSWTRWGGMPTGITQNVKDLLRKLGRITDEQFAELELVPDFD